MSKTIRKQTTTKATKRTAPKSSAKQPKTARPASKQARLIELLRLHDGATVDEIVKALDWQAHTVRGAISGALKKKLGLKVESEKVEAAGYTALPDSARATGRPAAAQRRGRRFVVRARDASRASPREHGQPNCADGRGSTSAAGSYDRPIMLRDRKDEGRTDAE